MSKRLSALFTSWKEDNDDVEGHNTSNLMVNAHSPNASASFANSPTPSRLHKHTPRSSTEMPAIHDNPYHVQSALTPLAPPPFLVEDGSLRRPPSGAGTGSRPASGASSPQSGPSRSRPQTPTLLVPQLDGNASPTSGKLNKRKSWMPGKLDKQQEQEKKNAQAWVAGLKDFANYDVTPLLYGGKVPEIWMEHGDTQVHLYPRSSGKGPCFKVHSSLFIDSNHLQNMCIQAAPSYVSPTAGYQDHYGMQTQFQHMSVRSPAGWPNGQSNPTRLSTNFSAPVSDPQEEGHIYLPLEFEKDMSQPASIPQGNDLELVVLYRNFFAFLTGGALVSTHRQPNLYTIFMGISTVLKRLFFDSADGATWGHVPTRSFAQYCKELRLGDCRSSREKTIEAIVLGENLRSWPLYNEGFVHAAGRLSDIKSARSIKYNKISPVTINRLERSSLEMEQRLLTVRDKLSDFDFPSMFAGIANSATSTEGKLVRFKAWKLAFQDFRRMTISYYRRKYGAWPPKASSKKNNFEESGLNRVLLRELYQDFTDLYDMLADKQNLTSRTDDMAPLADDANNDANESIQHALRRVESEYDRATPPVAPPIPFDVPIIPGFKSSFNRDHVLASKSSIGAKKLKETEVNELLLGSYNRENIRSSTWVQDFIAYERRLGQGKPIDEIIDCRCGQWLFIYAVLQSLPMTVVDARDIQHSEGVEYFLCMAPRGGRPWMKEDTAQSRAWYNVASGGGLVSLPADLIDHSVEGIYRRSHCWVTATRWSEEASGNVATNDVPPLPGLQPPPLMGQMSPHLSPHMSPVPSIGSSPAASPLLRPTSADHGRLSRISSGSSTNLGLEAMAVPPEHKQRPVSTYNPNMTFDAILGTQDKGKKGKKSKK